MAAARAGAKCKRRVVLQTPLPETTEARVVARLLSIDAAIRAHDEDVDGALDSCRAIFGVGRSIGDEPFLYAQAVRHALGELALTSSHRVLGQGEPSDAALARLQAVALDELAQPLLLVGLSGERAALTERVRMVGAGEAPASVLRDSLNTKINPSILPDPCASWARLWFEYQRAVTLDWMNHAVAIARRPEGEQPSRWKAWQSKAKRVKESQFGKYLEMLPLLFSPAVTGFGDGFSHYQGRLGATAILIAAERHRQKTGDWPASIETIDPGILPMHRSTLIQVSLSVWSTATDSFSSTRSGPTEKTNAARTIPSCGPEVGPTTWVPARGMFPCAGELVPRRSPPPASIRNRERMTPLLARILETNRQVAAGSIER